MHRHRRQIGALDGGLGGPREVDHGGVLGVEAGFDNPRAAVLLDVGLVLVAADDERNRVGALGVGEGAVAL